MLAVNVVPLTKNTGDKIGIVSKPTGARVRAYNTVRIFRYIFTFIKLNINCYKLHKYYKYK